jgi:DNA-binding SARP family transcriptional activator
VTDRIDSVDEASTDDAADTFWTLAKKGVAAWGHEPSIAEMTRYWRHLIEEGELAPDDVDLSADLRPAESAPGEGAPGTGDRPAGEAAEVGDQPAGEAAEASGSPLSPQAEDAAELPAAEAAAGAPVAGEAAGELTPSGVGRSAGETAIEVREAADVGDDGAVDVAELPAAEAAAGAPAVIRGPAPAVKVSAAAVEWLALPLAADVGPPVERAIAVAPVPVPVRLVAPIEVSSAAVAWLALRLDADAHPPAVPAVPAQHEARAAVRGSNDEAEEVQPAAAGSIDGGAADEELGEVGDPALAIAGCLAVLAAAEEADALALQPVGLAGRGLAFADCQALLERRRRAQQAHRRWGRQIALPAAPLDAFERELRHGADSDAAHRLDVALRVAAASASESGLPHLRWVEASADQVTLALAAPKRPPPGFVATGGGATRGEATGGEAAEAVDAGDGEAIRGADTASGEAAEAAGWTTTLALDELAPLAEPALAPWPALVPLGITAGGSELLVDLEAQGLVTVEGARDDVLGLLRAVVVALATTARCRPPRIVVVGLERELARLPGVAMVESLDVALTYAEAHVHRMTTALAAAGLGHTGELGTTDPYEALVVVSAAPPRDHDLRRRLAALAEHRCQGVGLLLHHPDPEPGPDPSSRLRIGATGMLEINGPDSDEGRPAMPARTGARRLDPADIRAMVALLAVARQWDGGMLALRPHLHRAATADAPEAEVTIRVLGDLEIVRSDGRPEELLFDPAIPEAVEVLTYLALRESSVTYGTLEANLFPAGTATDQRVHDVVAAARDLVGPSLLRSPASGRFALSERVITDYAVFCGLVARADDATDTGEAVELLRTALELVRAAPLDGVARRFPWAGPLREAIVSHVVDAADNLVGLCAARRDWEGAQWAARQGLLAAPATERLHRWLMHAAHALGDRDRLHQIFTELCDLVADAAVGVEPEDTLQPKTVQLLESLASPRAAATAPLGVTEPDVPGGTSPSVAVTAEIARVPASARTERTALIA